MAFIPSDAQNSGYQINVLRAMNIYKGGSNNSENRFFRTTHKTSHAMNLPPTRSELYCLTDLQFLPVACLRSWYVLYKLCQML